MATPTKQAAVSTAISGEAVVPFILTTRPDGYLPDMTGFDYQSLGTLEGGWHSLCPIRAGRDLALGEVIHAFKVRPADGEMLTFEYTAVKGALTADLWPAAFATFLQQKAQAQGLSAGGWTADGQLAGSGCADLRLWCRNGSRAFSTAPFTGNLVQALACNDQYTAIEGQTLCLQVRDLKTQHLYENHFFTAPAKDWALALCKQINLDSKLLRAGELDEKTCQVAPAAQGNAFWVAQCSELCVTLNEAEWWTGQDVDGGLALDADKAVQVWAYDAFSHRLLDSFSWTPSKTQCAAGKWLTTFGAALNKSSLGGWLQVGNKEKPASSTAASLWQRGEAIRVFSSLPGRDNWVEGPALVSAWKAETDVALVTVRHPYSRVLLEQAVFKPDQLKDQSAWETALAEFIEKQGWPQLRAWRQAADGTADSAAAGTGDWRLWSSRFAGLLVELDNLGDVASYQDSMLDSRRLPTDTPAKVAGSSASNLESRTELSFTHYVSHGALIVERCKGETVFVLSDAARARGYRVLNVRRCPVGTVYTSHRRDTPTDVSVRSITANSFVLGAGVRTDFLIDFDYPDHEAGGANFEVGYLGYLDDNFLWPRGTAISFKAPAAPPAYTPNNHLCEDYGNTCGSEVFDTGGESETGVDPRTGLFHAHYPIATLQGLRGRGPVCDLTLHYSPLRGNEAGLGDGWAWRFASLEIRDRRLTLADGVTLTFTDEEWTQLGEGKCLQKPACFISCTQDYTTFTLDLPSGRRELLSVPQAAGGDTDEPNDEFRMEIIRLLKAIKKKSTPEFPAKPSTATQWALAVLCVGAYYGAAAIDYAEAMSKWREKTKEIDQQIAYYQRPFVQLLPSEIMSPYGENLELTWKRQKGQFLLEQVCSGSEQLFKAVYDHARVKMSIWPGSSSECFDVQLSLENYLLMKLQRLEKKQVCQQVNCSYAVDPTLDRVLYRLEELDGSVERVEYQAESAPFEDKRPALPRVGKYILVAAGGAENHEVSYDYVGSYSEPQGGYTVKISALNNSRHTHYNARGEAVASASDNERFVDLYVRDPNGVSRSVKSVRILKSHLLGALMWCGHSSVGMYFDKLIFFCIPWPSASLYSLAEAEEYLEDRLRHVYSEVGQEILTFQSSKQCTSALVLLSIYFDRFKDFENANGEYSKSSRSSSSSSLDSFEEADCLYIENLISLIGEMFYPPLETKFNEVFRWLSAVDHLRSLEDFASAFKYELTNDYISDPVLSVSSMVFNAGGQLEKITATEGSLTYRYYYQDKGQNSIAPALGLPDLPALACGEIPPETTPPVMAEYQCDAHGNPLGLILYGYRTVLRNARQVIETDTIVTLEGVKVTLTADKLDVTADDVIMRIHQTSTTELKAKTPNDDCAAQEWSATDIQTTRGGGQSMELTRVQHFEDNPTDDDAVQVWSATDIQTTRVGGQSMALTTVQHFEDNPTQPGVQVRTTCTNELGEQEVKRELRSRYSRRCLEKVVNNTKECWTRDSMNRVLEHATYKAGSEAAWASTQTVYSVKQGYLTALSTEQDGSQTRRWLDGVQRVWRSEWRRSTSDAFVPLGLRAFKGLGEDDEVLSLNWDYLPGGLALAEPGQAVELPGQRPWSRELQDAEGTVEMGMGADTLLRTTQTVKPQADGSFVREEQVTATSGVARAGVRREYDASGRIVGFTRTLDGQSSTCRMTRDALGRVVEMTRPDGSVIKRAYEGFSSHVTQLKVGDQVLATQTLGKDSSLKTRKVGNRNYQYDGDKVTLPDNKTVIDTGTDGQYTVAGQLLSGLSQQGSVSTLACEPTDPAEAGFKTGRWQHSLSATPLPGRQSSEESTPRRTVSTSEWQSLRGVAVAAQRADGHCQRLFFDHLGRPLRSWQDHEDLLYRYDDHGRLTERRVQASKAGAQWQILSEHDVFDQETRRTFRHSGRTVFAQSLEWRGDGKLLAKHSERDGKRLRSERYSYDTLERLASYKCEAEQALDCPTDEGGKAVKEQTYTWDALSNLTQCVTQYHDGTQRQQDFEHDAANPTRLTRVTCNKVGVDLASDVNGQLLSDHRKQAFKYHPGGRLRAVCDEKGKTLARYAYDGHQRLAAQYVASDQSTCELRYDGDALIGESWFDNSGALVRQRSISAGIAEYEGAAVNWLIEDPQAGTAGLCGEQGVVLTPLLPFGEGTACDAISSGYDGMRRDPVTGSYHAGNGYRCYVPGLHRYSQPDWLSPFGEGGLNDYIHCPDPINLHDPSGAMMVSRWGQEQMLGQLDQALRDTQPMPVGGRWRGMALSAVLTVAGIGMSLVTLGTGSALVFAALSALSAASLALEVSSVLLEESHPKLSKALGIASTVTGVLSIGSVAGVFKQAAAVLRTAGKIALRTINTAKIVISAGWKFAKVAWRSGFTAARNAFTAAWKARNAARQGAKALLKAARETAGAGLGSLSTRQVGFAVEGQKVVTVRGWQARLYAQTSTLPKSVEFCISAFGVADAMKEYAEALGDIVGDDEDDKPEEGDMLTDMVWLEEKMRSAAIA